MLLAQKIKAFVGFLHHSLKVGDLDYSFIENRNDQRKKHGYTRTTTTNFFIKPLSCTNLHLLDRR